MRQLIQNKSGSFLTIFAFALSGLVAVSGLAVDYSAYNQERSRLQAAVDSAALATARQLGIASTSEAQIDAIALQYLKTFFTQTRVKIDGQEKNAQYDVNIINGNAVRVDLDYFWRPFFGPVFGQDERLIKASATASLAGGESICVIALDPASRSSLIFSGNATLAANNCGVYANSTNRAAITLSGQSTITSSSTYTSGGYIGRDIAFSPLPLTDTPPLEDPLATRPAPPISSCQPKTVFDRSTTLSPGTYCGGLTIVGNVVVSLLPGTYIIKDGPLIVNGNATLKGDDVGFYFTGADANFSFSGTSNISLSARESGVMAGLLFYQDRNSPSEETFVINSKDAERFEGTVYLPKGELVISQQSRLGQQSAWTAIITNKIIVSGEPDVVINSNFAASTVPVPRGLAPNQSGPRLIEK